MAEKPIRPITPHVFRLVSVDRARSHSVPILGGIGRNNQIFPLKSACSHASDFLGQAAQKKEGQS